MTLICDNESHLSTESISSFISTLGWPKACPTIFATISFVTNLLMGGIRLIFLSAK